MFFCKKSNTFALALKNTAFMNPLKEYILPVSGLDIGEHEYQFDIDNQFFTHFEGSLVTEGEFNVSLLFEKKSNLFVLDFVVEGTIPTECDRCTASIQLPIYEEHQLVVKLTNEPDLEEEADIVFLPESTDELDVSQYVYEFIILSIPLNKMYDCENDEILPCNQDVLGKIENLSHPDEEVNESTNKLWDAMKNINLDQNN